MPKATGVGEKDSDGVPAETPVPVSGTSFGLDAASVVNRKLAVLVPIVEGENTTLSPQEAVGAKVDPQVLPLVENSPALAPVRAMLLILSMAVPGLVKVTAVLPLELPVF